MAPLASSVALFSLEFRKRGIRYLSISPPEPPLVKIDRALVQQVFVNLLANARDAVLAAPQGTERWISMEVEPRENKLRFELANSGPTIPVEHRDRIFDPFYTTKPEGRGTGLGLSISRDIVARMNGTLTLDEDREETSFVVELPLALTAVRSPAED